MMPARSAAKPMPRALKNARLVRKILKEQQKGKTTTKNSN
jgi:hypothetical protein